MIVSVTGPGFFVSGARKKSCGSNQAVRGTGKNTNIKLAWGFVQPMIWKYN
jgi:hypothetical protein